MLLAGLGYDKLRSALRPVGVLLAGATLAGLLTASACDSDTPASGTAEGGADSGAGGQAACLSNAPCGEREARCVGEHQIQRTHDVSCSDSCLSGLCSGDVCGPNGAAENCPSGTSCRDKRVSVTGYTAVCDDGQGGANGDFEPCGNGALDVEDGEICDDGNRKPEDGCDRDCRVEPGYSCEIDQPCQKIAVDAPCQDACFDQDTCVERNSGVTCECAGERPADCKQVSFRSLLLLDGYSACSTSAISGDGTTVAGSCSRTDQNTQELSTTSVLWTLGDGVRELGTDTQGSRINALSADGSVLVGFDATGGAVRIADGKRDVVAENGIARATSADGSVVVGYTQNQAFRWTLADGLSLLEGPDGETDCYGLGLNADGSLVVGSVRTALQSLAVRWNADGEAELLPVPDDATASEAVAVSDDGSVVVGTLWFDDETQAVRWTDAGFEALEGPTPSTAFALSGDGSRIVGNAGSEPGVWDGSAEFLSLRDALSTASVDDWSFYGAVGVSSDGSVLAGSARLIELDQSGGDARAFVAFVP